SQEVLFWREIKVLRELLSDGASTATQLSAIPVPRRCAAHAFPVKTVMMIKSGVFRHDDGPLQLPRDPRERHPDPDLLDGATFRVHRRRHLRRRDRGTRRLQLQRVM